MRAIAELHPCMRLLLDTSWKLYFSESCRTSTCMFRFMITIDSCSVSFSRTTGTVGKTLLKARRERDTAVVTVGDL